MKFTKKQILNALKKETIKKVNGKYVLYPKKGGKRLGTHDSKDDANDQEAAIQISKHGRTGREVEATTTSAQPYYQTPKAFKKSTFKAIQVDDEDDSDELLGGLRDTRKKNAKLDREGKDHEGSMAKSQLERSMKYSKMIYNMIQNVDKNGDGEVEFPAWVQSKLTKSEDYLQSVFNYLDGKDGLEDKFQESVDEAMPMKMKPFSSSEARQLVNQDIKKMSKHLGKASQQSIKLMMNGVKGGKYTAMDISRVLKEGPAGRTHFGELGFLQQLWNKVRDGFRRYSKDQKLS